MFEITIRVLGGLLSTFSMSRDEMFLKRAVELADRLLVAFNTNSHIPISSINLKNKQAIKDPFGASLAEATTIQMEFKFLTYLTRDAKYWNAAQLVMKTIFSQERDHGLCPVYVDVDTGKLIPGSIRLGSRGDSYYGKLINNNRIFSKAMVANRTSRKDFKTRIRKINPGHSPFIIEKY